MSEQELAIKEEGAIQQISAFSSIQGFEAVQRMATMLSKSSMVPQQYQGNIPNCVIALEMANRVGASVFAVMQNLDIVHGKPAWGAKFIIAAINTCGRFSPLRFEMSGEGDDWGCYCWTYDKRDREKLEGPRVTIGMAKLENWYQKNGSKWKTMPDLMLRYRAASFFGKLYAPDILMGMQTTEEMRDIYEAEAMTSGPQRMYAVSTGGSVEDLNQTLQGSPKEEPAAASETPPVHEAEPAPAEDDGGPTVDEVFKMIEQAKSRDDLIDADDLRRSLPRQVDQDAVNVALQKRMKELGEK